METGGRYYGDMDRCWISLLLHSHFLPHPKKLLHFNGDSISSLITLFTLTPHPNLFSHLLFLHKIHRLFLLLPQPPLLISHSRQSLIDRYRNHLLRRRNTRNNRKCRLRPTNAPEGFVSPPYFDEGSDETEEEIATAFEELYGPAYSGESMLGKDIYVMDSKHKKSSGIGGKPKKDKIRDGFEERVVQVRRVTKVVKGGKQLKFRAIVVVGDKQGNVGVGCAKAKEVVAAVQKSAIDARRNIVQVPMTKYSTFPHRSEGDYGAAKVMLRPASPGTGVIAGGAVRIVLEMAGVENALGKQLGSNNALNNARATLAAVQQMRQFRDVAQERGIPMEELWK